MWLYSYTRVNILLINPPLVSELVISDKDLKYLIESIKLRSCDDIVIRYEDMIRLDQIIFISSLIMLIHVKGKFRVN
jgi:hypothetical protein